MTAEDIKVRKRRPLVPGSKSGRAAELVQAGCTYQEAAAAVGIDYNTVLAGCRVRGIRQTAEARQKTRRYMDETREAVRCLLKRGCTYTEIGAQLGISRCAVAGFAHRIKKECAA